MGGWMAITKSSATRVVYLWGAGATQAEAQRLGSPVNLMMRDSDSGGLGLTSRILHRGGDEVSFASPPPNKVDVEKLISLLAASGNSSHRNKAEVMRTNYFRELQESLAAAGVLAKPQLAIELLELHANLAFTEGFEVLTGLITTNHDGLLQRASKAVFGGINVGFEFTSKTFKDKRTAPPLIQVHGSFSWRFGLPIRIEPLGEKSSPRGTVWIPPSVSKDSKNYPFNRLLGAAYFLLAHRCDLLRIVGMSLTQNDWHILSTVFSAQRHQEALGKTPFRIELIMPPRDCETVMRECAYFRRMIPIGQLTDGPAFSNYVDSTKDYSGTDMSNPLRFWLEEKTRFHRNSGHLTPPPPTNTAAAA